VASAAVSPSPGSQICQSCGHQYRSGVMPMRWRRTKSICAQRNVAASARRAAEASARGARGVGAGSTMAESPTIDDTGEAGPSSPAASARRRAPPAPSRAANISVDALAGSRGCRGCRWFSARERCGWGELYVALTPGQRHELVAAPGLLEHANGKALIGEPSPLDTRRRRAAASRWSSSVEPGTGRAEVELGVRVERGTTPRGRCRAHRASAPGCQRGGRGARDRQPRCLSSL